MTTYSLPVPVRMYPDLESFKGFDRSTKVTMQCHNHPENRYVSKDPFASQIFPTFDTRDCSCTLSDLEVIDNGDGDILSEVQVPEYKIEQYWANGYA